MDIEDFLPEINSESARHFDKNDYIPNIIQDHTYLIYTHDRNHEPELRKSVTKIDISAHEHTQHLFHPISLDKQLVDKFFDHSIDREHLEKVYLDQLRQSYKTHPNLWRFMLFQPSLLIGSETIEDTKPFAPRWLLAQALINVHLAHDRQAYFQGELTP